MFLCNFMKALAWKGTKRNCSGQFVHLIKVCMFTLVTGKQYVVALDI